MHLEKRLGTQSQAIDYCQDPEKRVPGTQFFESGTKAQAGKRTDFEDIKLMCDAGEPISKIADTHFGSYVRYHKGIEKYRHLRIKDLEKQKPMTVEIFWGPTGTGKTFRAFTENPGAYWVCNPNSQNVFFDGYDGEQTIIIDEFYGWIPFNMILRLCDKYPMPGNTKGSMLKLTHTKVVITSNTPPRDWYKNIKEDLFAAFTRRITSCIEMTTRYVPEPNLPEPTPAAPSFKSALEVHNETQTRTIIPTLVTPNVRADKLKELRNAITRQKTSSLDRPNIDRPQNFGATNSNWIRPAPLQSTNAADPREFLDLTAEDEDSGPDDGDDPFS